MAEEAPGADVLASARTAEVPVAVVGRAVAALAEATLVRLRESDDVDHLQTTVTQLAHALSAVGQVLSTHEDTDCLPARFPPALIHRVARYLGAAAGLALEGVLPPDFDQRHAASLADTFRSDATALRSLVGG